MTGRGAGIAVAAGLFLAGAMVAWETGRMRIQATYGLGPQAMLAMVGAGLILLAVGNLVLALRGRMPAAEPVELRPILLILGGLALLIASIALGGGFIPGTALLFACTAAAFGRRAFLIDLGIGLGLAVLIHLLFVRLLTLSLPAGPLEALF
jgi:putative tricarboxylic transport membrane protein